MTLYNFAGILCIAALLVVTVSGYSHGSDGYGYIESRLLDSNIFHENAAAMVDFESCSVSTSAEDICQTANFKLQETDHPVHVCLKDGANDQRLCYYSDVRTCCKNATSILNCRSVTRVLVGGMTTSVTHYQRELSGEICIYPGSDVNVCDDACSEEGCFSINCPMSLECDSNGANCRCKEGFTEESECCDCAEDYYPSSDGTRCIKLCRDNCRTRIVDEAGWPTGECISCFRDYLPPNCCNCPPELVEMDGECKSACSRPQTLYFYIDATDSNTFENFCPLIVTMQMLVAALSPSTTSDTQIGALLFSDEAKDRGPSTVFDVGTPCRDAIQEEKNSLSSLMIEFGKCLDKDRKYNSEMYPSMCGEGTHAVAGLKEIYNVISTKRSSFDTVVVMLTDGAIQDDPDERKKVLEDYKKAGIIIIEAGIGQADLETMKLYSDIIMIENDPVKLGIAIVNKLANKSVLCQDEANKITGILGGAGLPSYFCRCHRQEHADKPVCSVKTYPTCGGDLSSALPNFPSQFSFEELVSLEGESLAEEIVAAVEDVLERFE